MIHLRFVDKILAKILFWRQLSAQRAELRRMSDELLKDIGLNRMESTREASRHFWDTALVEDDSLRDRPPAALKYKYN